eukprot:1628755-Alexandrium_andersonii.AAC.1
MSASLVGSEMCIRDRRLPGCPGGRELGCGRPGGEASTSDLHGRISMPVSYTHLTLPTICSV